MQNKRGKKIDLHFHLMILKWVWSWELYFVNWTLILQILNTERSTEKKFQNQ